MIRKRARTNAWFVSAMLCGVLAAAPVAIAQTPKEPAPIAKAAKRPMLPSTTIEGKVTQYLITPMGDVEGVLLDSGIVARLPAHMGKDLVQAVKVGDAVTVEGVAEDERSSFIEADSGEAR
jgi:hypothetical protein